MTESIYAPPKSDIAAPADDTARYYVVSARKFVVLSILTLTLYFVYWFYQNWKLIKDADKDDLWPVPRAIFYIFFTHSLFTDVKTNITDQGKEFEWNAGLYATLFVVLTIMSNLMDRFMELAKVPFNTTTVAISLLMPFLLTWLLLPAQRAINFASDDPNGSRNSAMTWANWLWMILGVLIWGSALFGYYVVLTNPSLL